MDAVSDASDLHYTYHGATEADVEFLIELGAARDSIQERKSTTPDALLSHLLRTVALWQQATEASWPRRHMFRYPAALADEAEAVLGFRVPEQQDDLSVEVLVMAAVTCRATCDRKVTSELATAKLLAAADSLVGCLVQARAAGAEKLRELEQIARMYRDVVSLLFSDAGSASWRVLYAHRSRLGGAFPNLQRTIVARYYEHLIETADEWKDTMTVFTEIQTLCWLEQMVAPDIVRLSNGARQTMTRAKERREQVLTLHTRSDKCPSRTFEVAHISLRDDADYPESGARRPVPPLQIHLRLAREGEGHAPSAAEPGDRRRRRRLLPTLVSPMS